MEAFHAGERALQARAGVAERLAEIGSRVVRDAMPDQHRELFEKLPFMLLGALDPDQQPWATLLAGPPGFVRTPDARTLSIAARLATGDAVALALQAGAPVGLLGIEPHTRRRNRVNGLVAKSDAESLAIDVRQSFGNCPKYIQARSVGFFRREAAASSSSFGSTLPDAARELVARADTFFIASASPEAGRGPLGDGGGVDVSHRGGLPGFVRVDATASGSELTVPDYLGNFFFNTLGNLAANPRAGLLFVDWDRGDMLMVATDAEIVGDGAQRLLRLRVREGRWLPEALPLRAEGEVEFSPQLAGAGR